MNIHTTAPRGVQSYSGPRSARTSRQRLNFETINVAARASALAICQRLLPGGKRQGSEYIVRNPKRPDAKPGSFKINIRNGRWCDFAIGQGGSDLISLVAYLYDLRQGDAARRLADMLHLNLEGRP